MEFDLSSAERKSLIELAFEKIDYFYEHTKSFRISPELDVKKIRAFINQIDLEKGIDCA